MPAGVATDGDTITASDDDTSASIAAPAEIGDGAVPGPASDIDEKAEDGECGCESTLTPSPKPGDVPLVAVSAPMGVWPALAADIHSLRLARRAFGYKRKPKLRS
jgi:hypothetical protein